MKKNSSIFKFVSLILAVISITFVFTSCEAKPEPPEEKAFSLVMDFSQTTVSLGEKVTYRAILKNAEHESYTLTHSADLIHIYVVKSEDYIDPESHMALSDAVVSESQIAPHGQVDEFYEFTPTEKGEYILKAYSAFTIEGKDSTKEYFYECEEMTITVV